MIDLNHSGAEGRSLTERIIALIDAGMEEDAAGKRRSYLGASALGAACERAIQLDYIRANDLPAAPEPAEGFSGQTLRIFDFGHAIEPYAVAWLTAGGFELSTEKRDGGQHGFAAAGGRFRGHVDGVILTGPDWLAVPCIFEHKTMKSKVWQETVKKGVASVHPAYCAQVAVYQAYLDLQNPALFMATNKDTAELHFELLPFDGGLAQKTSDRAVRILQATDAGELLPRGFAGEDHFECRRCRWRTFCWA